MLGLLNESDRLTALTDLVGVGALPGKERMVLLGGRLLREGVLQQSAQVAQRRILRTRKDRRARRRGSRGDRHVPRRGVGGVCRRSSSRRPISAR